MAVIKVNGIEMDVDIRAELEEFQWTRARWSENKLIASSPYRNDRSPSFFCNLEGEYAGTWGDAGAYDSDWESGNFPKLLSFLRDETYEETCEYLLHLYGKKETENNAYISISPVSLKEPTKRITLDDGILAELAYRSPYLGKRRISEKVQRFMGVGFSRESNAISMPWRHADGTLANIKYRKIEGKAFWYEKGAAPIRTLVYGIDKVYRHNLTEAVVCEAEIDAMSWMEAGKPAIALGGTAVTQTQLDLIKRSPIERVIIAKDNDKAGGKLGERLAEGLRVSVEVAEVALPDEYKDANEALVAGVELAELPTRGMFEKIRIKVR